MKLEVSFMSKSIYPINPPTSNLPFIVMGVGYEDNQPHVLRKDGYPTHQIFICKSGEGTLRVGENTYTLHKGDFFYLLPNCPHEYFGTTDCWELWWLTFSGNHFDDILSELKLNEHQVGPLHNMEKVETLYKHIYAILKTEEPIGRMVVSSSLYEILVELYTQLQANQVLSTFGANTLIHVVKSYIDENFTKPITIEELSTLVDITPQYLCKLFKKHLNLRPFQYITMKRIQFAKKMLLDTSLSINTIAHASGFTDFSYFCAVFKKYEKISPTQFKGSSKSDNG